MYLKKSEADDESAPPREKIIGWDASRLAFFLYLSEARRSRKLKTLAEPSEGIEFDQGAAVQGYYYWLCEKWKQ